MHCCPICPIVIITAISQYNGDYSNVDADVQYALGQVLLALTNVIHFVNSCIWSN